MDFGVLAAGLGVCFAASRFAVDPPAQNTWAIVLFFYFVFYRRIAYVIYWARDTYRCLQSTIPQASAVSRLRATEDEGKLPRLHVLVAAYNASSSVGSVIRALDNQDYPRDRYDAWIVTANREVAETRSIRSGLVSMATDQREPLAANEDALIVRWWADSLHISSMNEWARAVTSGVLRSHLRTKGAPSLVMRDLLGRLLRSGDWQRELRACGTDILRLAPADVYSIEAELARVGRIASRVAADFERLLGSREVYPRTEIEEQLLTATARRRQVRKVGRRIVRRFAEGAQQCVPPTADQLRRSAAQLLRTTQSRVAEAVELSGAPNLHHVDTQRGGFKPGALNAVYEHIRGRGLLNDDHETFFLIIDSDSLLPAHALGAIAAEVDRAPSAGVMQLASVPTANFFVGGWFSRFVSFTDSVGAVGKWARTTRRHLRPDLAAGSGAVVTAALAKYIAERTGAPWAEDTITEDARLIIGQFGLMDGARLTNGVVPTYLIEAVPSGNGFSNTYRSYWNQRRRWTIGGYAEFFCMLRVPRWIKYARFDRIERRWVEGHPIFRERCGATLRQYYRAIRWGLDHFWWGLGSAIVLMHWSIAALIVSEPGRPISLLGVACLLLLPWLVLRLVGRPLGEFIPGGLSRRDRRFIYLLTFPAIWLYVLPVIWTQIACAVGDRSQTLDWRPTLKPTYDAPIPTARTARLGNVRQSSEIPLERGPYA